MSLKGWEAKVLAAPGASERVREIEDELRLAAGLTALREQAGLSQRELARRIGVSQPRIAAIERSRNVTIDLLEQYVGALGARLEVSVVQGRHRTPLVTGKPQSSRTKVRADKVSPREAIGAAESGADVTETAAKSRRTSRKTKAA
jgi:transcriptional regulator with XRE-family HTH domain